MTGRLMSVIGALLVAFALLGCATAPKAETLQTPSSLHSPVSEVHSDTIAYFEPLIMMPRGARPLEAYDRYYAMERINDRNIVRGVLLLRSSFGGVERQGMTQLAEGSNIYWGEPTDLPMIADGGCGVITVFFDTVSSQFLQIENDPRDHLIAPAVCNGR